MHSTAMPAARARAQLNRLWPNVKDATNLRLIRHTAEPWRSSRYSAHRLAELGVSPNNVEQ